MRKHPYRAVLIWLAMIVAVVNVYPTIGWMMLSNEARQARLDQWQQEDDEWAKTKHNAFSQLAFTTKRWAQFDRDRVINLGLDLQGGIHMVLSFNLSDLSPERLQEYRDRNYSDADIQREVQEIVLQQIRRRVNDFEAKEPIIQALGPNQIQIQLPGEKNVERAKNLIKKTAQLNFHIVAEAEDTAPVFQKIKDKYPDEFTPFIQRPKLRGDHFTVSMDNYDRVRRIIEKATAAGLVPEEKIIAFSQTPKPTEPQKYSLYLLDKKPIASGEGLRSSVAIPDQSNPPYWRILFEFNNAAGALFGEATEKNINRAMAIVLDDVVCSAPVIRDRISTSGEISGSFEGPEAADLAIALNSGSMFVPVHEEFTRVVGATLGADAVHKSVMSAVLSLLIVAAFMVVYYMWAGLVAMVGLASSFVLIIAAMAYFGMTLTLPGVAGLILTIGMAVDANVLIYERIREELRLGHSLASSIDNGFQRATITILDANITTLIAAAVLMQFGTGPIEGFAVTLSIGVCSSVFSALVVCRALFDFLLNAKLLKKLVMLSVVPEDPKIPFLALRRYAAIGSILLIVAGMSLFGWRGMDNFGVDFTQGTNINVTLKADHSIPSGDLRVALANAGFISPVVQRTGENEATDSNMFIIRVGDVETSATAPSVVPATETPAPAEAAPVEAAPAEATPAPVTETTPVEASPAPAPETAPVDEAPVAPPNSASAEPEADEDATAAAAPSTLTTVADRIQQALAPLTSSGNPTDVIIEDEQTVGPAVGKQLRWDAVKALFWSFVFIIIYLWFRFELKFGVAAIIALFHDVLITLGVFAVMRRQIDMGVIAALLTIVGYSLNDTIVVFDRIREDLGVYRGKGYKYGDILNIAVNRTLSRTLLTALTTLFTVVVLFFFGGAAINNFALALIVGIVIGTYSSIFIATPIVFFWQQYQGRHELPTDTGRESGGRKRPVRNRPVDNPA
jgi:SecD/SecF fusion protein